MQESESSDGFEKKKANYCLPEEVKQISTNAKREQSYRALQITHRGDFQDELSCFTQYLLRTGTYAAIRSTLKAKVIMLLDQKFKVAVSTVDTVESQV